MENQRGRLINLSNFRQSIKAAASDHHTQLTNENACIFNYKVKHPDDPNSWYLPVSDSTLVLVNFSIPSLCFSTCVSGFVTERGSNPIKLSAQSVVGSSSFKVNNSPPISWQIPSALSNVSPTELNCLEFAFLKNQNLPMIN